MPSSENTATPQDCYDGSDEMDCQLVDIPASYRTVISLHIALLHIHSCKIKHFITIIIIGLKFFFELMDIPAYRTVTAVRIAFLHIHSFCTFLPIYFCKLKLFITISFGKKIFFELLDITTSYRTVIALQNCTFCTLHFCTFIHFALF